MSADGASLFTAFLKQEFSQENIEFWTEVENYKKAKPSRLTAKAKRIFEEYIAVKASKEVSLVTACTPADSLLLPHTGTRPSISLTHCLHHTFPGPNELFLSP